MLPPVLSDQRWRLLAALILTGLLQSVCLLGLVMAARAYLVSGRVELGVLEIGIATAAILCLAAGRFIERFVAELLAQRYVCQLRQQVFEHTLKLPVSDREMVNKGGTQLRLTSDMSALRNWIVQGQAPLLVLGVWFTVAVIGLIQLHPALALSLILPVTVAIVGNYVIGKHLYRASETVRRRRSVLIRNTMEKLRQFKLIKLFNQQGKERRTFTRYSRDLRRSQLSKARISALLRAFNEAMVLGAVLVLLLTGLSLSNSGQIPGDYIALVLTASLYLLAQMRRLSRLYELWTLKQVAQDKLTRFLKRPTVEDEGRRKLPTRALHIKLRRVEVENRFLPFSANLGAGSRVVLTGQQGCGKSSMLLMLAGLLPLSGGKLVFNGRDSARFHPALWAQTVALVSAELPLLRGSLESNLFYGARKCQKEYTREVLAATGLSGCFANGGFKVKEAGTNLSGGVRFQVMLARALLRRPKLLLIDDDAALYDPEIQQILLRLFRFFDGAIVIAAELPGLAEQLTARWDLTCRQVKNFPTYDADAANADDSKIVLFNTVLNERNS